MHVLPSMHHFSLKDGAPNVHETPQPLPRCPGGQCVCQGGATASVNGYRASWGISSAVSSSRSAFSNLALLAPVQLPTTSPARSPGR